jgi:hypothetical protein
MPTPYKTLISVAPVTLDLTVLETVKQELGVTDSNSDALLARLISEQSEVAASFCRRPLAQATIIDSFRVLSGADGPLMPSRRPIVAISEIVEDGTTLIETDYEYDEITGFLWKLDSSDERSWWSAGKTTISYVGGYELLTTLPRDIERAVLILIKESWFSLSRDPRARAETVDGIGRTEFWVGGVPGSGGIPGDAAALLQPYVQYSC